MEPYSKRTAALIDCEVQRLVAGAFRRAVELVERNKATLDRIVEALLEKEALSADELKVIITCPSESSESAAPPITPL